MTSSPPRLKLAGHVLELEGTREWCCVDCDATFSEFEVGLMKAARRDALEEAATLAAEERGTVGQPRSQSWDDACQNIEQGIRTLKGSIP